MHVKVSDVLYSIIPEARPLPLEILIYLVWGGA